MARREAKEVVFRIDPRSDVGLEDLHAVPTMWKTQNDHGFDGFSSLKASMAICNSRGNEQRV